MARVELEVADAIKAAQVVAYWDGYADGARTAARQARDRDLQGFINAGKAQQEKPPANPAPPEQSSGE